MFNSHVVCMLNYTLSKNLKARNQTNFMDEPHTWNKLDSNITTIYNNLCFEINKIALHNKRIA